MPYYGLYIPAKNGGSITADPGNTSSLTNGLMGVNVDKESVKSPYVFHKKNDALEILKQHKDARLKEFLNEDDALKYAQTGYEIVQTKYSDSKAPSTALEKASFRAPTKQELIEFRKIIENGDCERIQTIIWENPRYLVSSGDTPTTLKEGYRYNAMHVCAIAKQPKVAELILKTVSDTNFADLLTGKKNDKKMCEELCANLLDYYLNMPEKGRNETPLHLAAKVGCVPMVEVLVSYSECKMTRNSSNFLPADIICSRDVGFDLYTYNTIKMLLEEHFYVPVLRCNDGSFPPLIGQPFSSNSPPYSVCDPLSPELEVQALAGPMRKNDADRFFRRWKTPSKVGNHVASGVVNKLFLSPIKLMSRPLLNSTPRRTPILSKQVGSSPTAILRRRELFNSSMDTDIINENFDNYLCWRSELKTKTNNDVEQCSVFKCDLKNNETNNNDAETVIESIKNSTETQRSVTPLPGMKTKAFLTYRNTTFVSSPLIDNEMDVSYKDELNLLNITSTHDTSAFMERHIKNSDPEKGLECIGRELAKEQSVEWREHWDFLNEFVDISSTKGLEMLEKYLMQRKRDVNTQNQESFNTSAILDHVCNALEKFCFTPEYQKPIVQNREKNWHYENGIKQDFCNTSNININTSMAHQLSTPYKYVEKSLQVHAKRITKIITHNMENMNSINDALVLELRRVKSLIYSFKEDETFMNVTFEKVHSRIGSLVSIFLQNSQEVTSYMRKKIWNILQKLIVIPGERREHMDCVLTRICDMLEHPVEQIIPEALKTEELCFIIWSQEEECNCGWESNAIRKTCRRNRMEARYKSHQRLKYHEKLFTQQSYSSGVNFCERSAHNWSNAFISNDLSEDEDTIWADASADIIHDDEEVDVWSTPPDSPSFINQIVDTNTVSDECVQQVFIYGNEPTKRDLDVLNAICHINIDYSKYPNIYSWKAALLRYPNNELDYLPSPRMYKKSYSLMLQDLNKSDNILQVVSNRSQSSQSLTDSVKSKHDIVKMCNEMVKEQMKKQADIVSNVTDEKTSSVNKVLSSLSRNVDNTESSNLSMQSAHNLQIVTPTRRQLLPNNELPTSQSSHDDVLDINHIASKSSINGLDNGIIPINYTDNSKIIDDLHMST